MGVTVARLKASLGIAIAALLAGCGGMGSSTRSSDVIVQGTTDVRDAGLLNDVIVPGFEKRYPQYNLKYIAVGSGEAIANAEGGQGDALLVHAPTSEKPFVTGGYSAERFGRAVFYSDYVIVGPGDDPAGVFDGARHDVVTGFEKIAAAAKAGKANFISRGDDSGTNVQEKLIWQKTSVKLNSNDEPGDASKTGNPPWYHRAGSGQAQTVQLASQCPFHGGGCYDITDRGTFNRLARDRTVTNLKVVADHNDPRARGGANLLTNPFTAYAVNPDKVANVNLAGAMAFLTYLTSPGFQRQVGEYPTRKQAAFLPDARPRITVEGDGIPSRVSRGDNVTVSGRVANRLPGSQPLAGDPIELRSGPDDTLAKRTTDAGGVFELRFRAKRSAKVSVFFPTVFPDLRVNPLVASGTLGAERKVIGKLTVLNR